MPKILVSACLLGEPVRHDGRSKAIRSSALSALIKQNSVMVFCPEVAGGLPTPRAAAEIQQADGFAVIDVNASVKTDDGADVTRQFLDGAQRALALCRQYKIGTAILSEASPSCGSGVIYDGSFTRCKRAGVGVTTALLRRNGIVVFSQHQLDEALASLQIRAD